MPPATRVVRHESDVGRWELVLREPDPRLRDHVLVLEDYDERVSGPVRERHLPTTFVPLVLNFGPPYRLLDRDDPASASEHGSFVGGLSQSGAVTESSGTAACVEVNLTPLGARRVLGVPMAELAERVVPLADVLGAAVDILEERVAETADATARLALVETFCSSASRMCRRSAPTSPTHGGDSRRRAGASGSAPSPPSSAARAST